MKIALVGSAPSSNLLAPYNDPSWQIWACSPDNANIIPRADLWFELHGDLGWEKYQSWAAPYVRWLNQQTFPIYAQDDRFIPRAMRFPKEEMLAKFGCYFFTSSFSWMIAFAIDRGATEIGIFGIDMATDLEYARQRPGFQHFIQLAASRGIKIVAPNESDILQPPPLYGYDISTAFGRKLHVRRDEICAKIENFRKQRAEIDYHITHLSGALDDLDYVQTIWTGHRDELDDERHVEWAKPAPAPAPAAPYANGHDPHPGEEPDTHSYRVDNGTDNLGELNG